MRVWMCVRLCILVCVRFVGMLVCEGVRVRVWVCVRVFCLYALCVRV